jgi:2-phosphosulfolactate phosphatase
MKAQVVLLPRDLRPEQLDDRVVVVLDVLRATTSMIAALDAGAKEIRIFDSLDAARAAARGVEDKKSLCGEQRCRKPPDFDLGNSPADFTTKTVKDRTLFMSTTNGTRAIVSAQAASTIFIGALVNARAVARLLQQLGRDVTLLCAGTEGEYSEEDAFGAGAILAHLAAESANEEARKCEQTFLTYNFPPAKLFRTTTGGRNIIAAGLERDLEFAARLSVFDVVGEVRKVEDNQIAVSRAAIAV